MSVLEGEYRKRVRELEAQLKHFEAENAALKAQIAELRKHLGPGDDEEGSKESLECKKGEDSIVDHEKFMVWTSGGKVDARAKASQGKIQFLRTMASIDASEFVGIRALSREETEGLECRGGSDTEGAAPIFELEAEAPVCPRPINYESATRMFARERNKHFIGREHYVLGQKKPFETGGRDADGNELYLWELVWKRGGGHCGLRCMLVETNMVGAAKIHNELARWNQQAAMSFSEVDVRRESEASASSAPEALASDEEGNENEGEGGETVREKAHKRTNSAGSSLESGEQTDVKATLVTQEIMKPNTFVPQTSEPSSLMTDIQFSALAARLPRRFQRAKWQLVYSTKRDGISLKTFLRKASQWSCTVLVVKDKGHFTFGTFCTDPWRANERYQGTGETFVFQLSPCMLSYRWSGRNSHFMYGKNDAIAVGGCHFALYIDDELAQGSSMQCDTFNSPSLSSSEEFEVLHMELWGFL